MSSSHSPSQSSSFDEHRWIIQIQRALQEEDPDQDSDVPVSIFAAPKALMLISPESYTPQLVALGPYHHWRPELHEMERYKLSAARRYRNHLKGFGFDSLVNHLAKFELWLRACYHQYLNFNSETLSWMMAIDSCFLLEFLQVFAVGEGRVLQSMSHLVDATGQKSGHNAVLRDMVMLENQIPLFVLRRVMEFQLGSMDKGDDLLCPMLLGFCMELSPFKMVPEVLDFHQVCSCAHLLDLLYCLIVPRSDEEALEIASSQSEQENMDDEDGRTKFQKAIHCLRAAVVSLIRRLLASRPVRVIVMLPWKIVSNLPAVVMVKSLLQESRKGKPEALNCTFQNGINKPPLMEEIAIPSVTELSKAGVKFSVTNSGIFSTSFDERTGTLQLPKVSLDVNTEVTMRNLVAYEACSASGPLVFTRYTELINGIIDTAEDAKILREQGIILNHLTCDGDVADMWNGMSKSIRLTKVPFLDKVIKDVNRYHNVRWRVRIQGFLKTNIFGAWQPMTLLAAVLLLFFMSLQTLCSVFNFARLFLHHRN